MVQVKKTVHTPAQDRETVDHLICDLCGKKNGGEDWEPAGHKILETTIEMDAGVNYGSDGGSRKTTSFDICPACFETKLVPWMASQGAMPTVGETDW